MAKLMSTVNTRTMERRVLRAARAAFNRRVIRAFYEHGHWWVEVAADGRPGETDMYDVVDATGPRSTDGFDFEQC